MKKHHPLSVLFILVDYCDMYVMSLC